MDHHQRVDAQSHQRFRGHIRRHARMPVPISAHPVSKNGFSGSRSPPRKRSGLNPAAAHAKRSRSSTSGSTDGENIPQIVHDVPALVGELRLFEQDLAGAPEPLQRSLRLFP